MKTVTVILRGGLGNQMFEYAAGVALAQRNNSRLLIDTTFLNDRFPRRQFTYRSYDLDVFQIEPEFTMMSKISHAAPIPGFWLGLDLFSAELKSAIGARKMVKEKQERVFDPNVYAQQGSVALWGFWQNEKYFADAAEQIRRAFTFRHPLADEALHLKAQIEETNSISISVRRGDYMLPANVKIFGETDTNYYDRAIAHMAAQAAKNGSSPHFFIFSDDIAWCRDHIKPDFPTTYIDDATRGFKAGAHLQLMSLCKHNIIANSSFSWWGAWLNRNSDKIVIAPKRWSHDARTERDDVIPVSWLAL